MAQTLLAEEHSISAPCKTISLQEILLTPNAGVWELFFRVEGCIRCTRTGLECAPFSHVSFDTYLSSFYEAYWVEHTCLQHLSLTICGTGRVRCCLYRQRPGLGSELIAAEVLNLSTWYEASVSIEIPKQPATAGRIFFEIEGQGVPFKIERLAWETETPPSREVSLGAVICTYKREDYLVRNTAALLAARNKSVHKLVVVNQAEPLARLDFETLLAENPDRLHLIEQDNFGGTGGFTRGALELLASGRCTHILFLDDDVELMDNDVETAISFLRYAKRDLVVGGQMLDIQHRTRMFDSGARVNESQTKTNYRGIDLSIPESLDELAAVAKSDFTGWWFTVFPIECFHNHGLPLPFFIHVDDVEFGVRLADAGIPSVALPPVSVWHEPFSIKPPSWFSFYDVRNWLIFASLYPERFELKSPKELLRELWTDFLRYDYHKLSCTEGGFRAFLDGCCSDGEGIPAWHLNTREFLDRRRPELTESCPSPFIATHRDPKGPMQAWFRLLASSIRLLANCPKKNPAGDDCIAVPEMPFDYMDLGRSYVLRCDVYNRRFRYSWSESWRQLARCIATVTRYAFVRDRAVAEWRGRFREITSPEYWATQFRIHWEG